MTKPALMNYIILVAIIGFFVWRFFRTKAVQKKIPELLEKGAVIVDVRTNGEYNSGHFPGSLNIPLQDLGWKASELDSSKPVLVCCASGSRSAMAASILRRKGFSNVINIGAWNQLLKLEKGKQI